MLSSMMKKIYANLLLITVITIWLPLNLYFGARYVEMILSQQTTVERVLVVFLILWILLASFFACYHFSSFVFSFFILKNSVPVKKCYKSSPAAAILYPCLHDLKEEAIQSFLDQDYSNYHIFILDDSTDTLEQKKVDVIALNYESKITVIRREERKGYKAGNLNNALDVIKDTFKYFAVADADEILPENFLTETVAIAEANTKIGFIQASHELYGETKFSKRCGAGIDMHWDHFLPARNRFGFVYFYGHGALIRTEACLKIGGFPEIVSEDVALAVRMRKIGYEGYYASELICKEEVPPTYLIYRKRNSKVIRGTLEFLWKEFPSFFRSKSIGLNEKVDLLIASSILYVPIPFLLYVIILHLILPLIHVDTYSITFSELDEFRVGYIRTAVAVFKPLWGWDSLAFTLFSMFSSLVYLIPNFFRAPQKVVKHIWWNTTIYLSGTINVFIETLIWLLTRKTTFQNTGDRLQQNSGKSRIVIEFGIGLFLFFLSVYTGSLFLMSVAFSILLIPLLISKNLEGKLCTFLALIPMSLTIVAILSIPLSLVGATGVMAGMFLAHH